MRALTASSRWRRGLKCPVAPGRRRSGLADAQQFGRRNASAASARPRTPSRAAWPARRARRRHPARRRRASAFVHHRFADAALLRSAGTARNDLLDALPGQFEFAVLGQHRLDEVDQRVHYVRRQARAGSCRNPAARRAARSCSPAMRPSAAAPLGPGPAPHPSRHSLHADSTSARTRTAISAASSAPEADVRHPHLHGGMVPGEAGVEIDHPLVQHHAAVQQPGHHAPVRWTALP